MWMVSQEEGYPLMISLLFVVYNADRPVQFMVKNNFNNFFGFLFSLNWRNNHLVCEMSLRQENMLILN